MRSLLLAPLLLLALSGAACSSSTSDGAGGSNDGERPPDGACYENPMGCGDDETCGFDDADGEEMSCLPAGPKGDGESCTNVAGAPECGHDLVCLQLSGAGSGACVPFCDGDAPCGDGKVCGNAKTEAGHSFYVCIDG